MSQEANWVQNPTKKQMLIVSTVYAISLFLLIVSMSNFFQELPDFRRNYLLIVLVFFGSITTGIVIRNYFKNR